MRSSDLLLEPVKKYRTSINPPYKRKDLISIIGTLFILLALPLTVFVATKVRPWGPRAAGTAAAPTNTASIIEPGSMVTEANYVIFIDGSSYYAKNGKTGEIQFSGTDAANVIQLALNAIPQGGVVQLTEGLFQCSVAFTVGAAQTLRGVGEDSTTVQLKTADATVNLGTNKDLGHLASLEYLKVIGGDANGGGRYANNLVTVKSQYHRINRVRLGETAQGGTALRIEVGNASRYSNLYIDEAAYGIDVVTGGSYDQTFDFVDIGTRNTKDIQTLPKVGLRIAQNSGSMFFRYLSIWGFEDDVLLENGAGEIYVSQPMIWGARHHAIHISGGAYNIYFHDGRIGAGSMDAANTYPDVLIENNGDTVKNIGFYNCQFQRDDTAGNPTRAIQVNASGSGTRGPIIIQGNVFTNWDSVSKVPVYIGSGWTTVIRDNIGFATENSGTATIASGSTYVDVSHGLSAALSAKDISITPTGSLAHGTTFWVSNIGASSFRINVDTAPGTGISYTFAWKAEAM